MSDPEPIPTEEDKPEPTEEDKPEPVFTIKNEDDLYRLMTIARGGDPNAQQTLNDFLQFTNNIERSNFPNVNTVLCIAQLTGYSELYYPGNPNNPFALVADKLSIAFMAKGGEKSKQFVEMMKQTPSLEALQVSREQQQSITDKLLGRGKTE